MSTSFLTFYVLIWPVAVAGVLAVIVRAFFGEMRAEGRLSRPRLSDSHAMGTGQPPPMNII